MVLAQITYRSSSTSGQPLLNTAPMAEILKGLRRGSIDSAAVGGLEPQAPFRSAPVYIDEMMSKFEFSSVKLSRPI
jgi:hypothetical protein